MKRITLRAARQRLKLTQVQLAERTGLDQPTISRLELQPRLQSPGFTTVMALAKALDVDPSRLVFGRPEVAEKSA